MKNDVRVRLEKNRLRLSIKSMYFNRYLLVRYVSALFFFTNLYWLILLIMSDSSLYFIPVIFIIALLVSIAEQVKIYSDHTSHAKYTIYCFIILLISNVGLIVFTCFSSSFSLLFPFLVDQAKSKILILVILNTGILLCVIILYRLYQIKHNGDKQLKRIKQYEEAVNLQ